MLKNTKPIDYELLSKDFKIIDGVIYRKEFRGYNRRRDKSDKYRIMSNHCNTNRGYCMTKWNGKHYLLHRLIWVLYNKRDIPENMEIDHINGNRIDNRIENLRLVDCRGQAGNRKYHRNGKLLGAMFNNQCNRWQAKIKINGKSKHLGLFNTEKEAHEAYMKAKKGMDVGVDIDSDRLEYNDLRGGKE